MPEEPPREGTVVAVRSMTAAEVVLSISEHDPAAQRAAGHLVQFTDGARVRLRPWAIRYAPPAELDAMAAAAGLALEHRWEDFDAPPVRRRQPPPRQRLRAGRAPDVIGRHSATCARRPSYPGKHCESDAPQPTHRAVGHDRGRAGPASFRLRAAGAAGRSRPRPTVPVLPGQRRSPPSPRWRPSTRAAGGGCASSPTCTRRSTATPGSSSTTSDPVHVTAEASGIHEVFVLHARPRRRARPTRRRATPRS